VTETIHSPINSLRATTATLTWSRPYQHRWQASPAGRPAPPACQPGLREPSHGRRSRPAVRRVQDRRGASRGLRAARDRPAGLRAVQLHAGERPVAAAQPPDPRQGGPFGTRSKVRVVPTGCASSWSRASCSRTACPWARAVQKLVKRVANEGAGHAARHPARHLCDAASTSTARSGERLPACQHSRFGQHVGRAGFLAGPACQHSRAHEDLL